MVYHGPTLPSKAEYGAVTHSVGNDISALAKPGQENFLIDKYIRVSGRPLQAFSVSLLPRFETIFREKPVDRLWGKRAPGGL